LTIDLITAAGHRDFGYGFILGVAEQIALYAVQHGCTSSVLELLYFGKTIVAVGI
jgi:hypothetical protein